MILPNFLHVGAAKAASSWLWRACQEHPEIYVPLEDSYDNVNFFTVHYHRGLDWYSKTYFEDYDGEKAIGEFSNSYMCFAPAIERINRDIPDVRLTMTLRDPVERAFLNWAHLHLKNPRFDIREGLGVPFEKLLDHHGHCWFRHWIAPGFYARHLEHIYRFIPRENVLVGIYDDLLADEGAYLERYFSFLGVDSSVRPSVIGMDINPDTQQTKIEDWVSEDIRRELACVYRDDIEKLQDMLGRDLNHWLNP
jgi:hypothetical protein